MSLIGVTLVTKCVASYNKRRLRKAILAVYIATKDILGAVPVAKHLKGDWFTVLR